MLRANRPILSFRAMARSLLLACLISAVGGFTAETHAQRAREEMRLGIEAAAHGDTVRALAALERAVSIDPELAEAHFHRGVIYSHMASGKSTDFEDRKRAQDALEEALRHDPDNPLYLLELGKLMLKQQIRVDARRVLQRALDAAARADATTLAEVHYQLGQMHEQQWQRFRYRHNLPLNIPQLNADAAAADAEYVWRLLDSSVSPGDEQGFLERERMLEHYRAALAAHPGHEGAASHLLAFLYDEGRLDEYLAVARGFVEAAPSSPVAYLALGLGLHRQAKEEEAAGAFQYALSLMQPREREEFESLARILGKQAEKEYIQLTEAQQREYRRRFWAHGDPLYLTPTNEFWLEYMARMTYADIRFGVPEYRLRGWETDRGVIYIRYGEPARKATFSPSTSHQGDFEAIGKITTVWTYGEKGPVFVFRQNPGYRLATFANDFRAYADDYRYRQPVYMDAPSLPERHDVPIQVVRFRGPDGALDLEVHALLPLDRLGATAPVARGTVESGLFIQDERAAEVERVTRSEVVDFRAEAAGRLESWRTTLDPGRRYLVGVEARDPLTWHAAVGREVVPPKAFPAGELGISDLLLADEVEPVVAEPVSRSDFRVKPNPAMAFGPDEPVGLYFEVYNLMPDEEQYASYEIELVVTVEEIHRTGPALKKLLGELADRWGFTEEGSSAVQLRFQKEARVLARDAIPEYFKVQLPDAPPGRYGLKLVVRDRNADREAAVEREFLIESEDDQ